MKQPISACIIVRNDPHLRKTIESIAPHVSEIVVAYTGGKLDEYSNILRMEQPGTVLKVCGFGLANDEFGLNDFSAARNFSFEQATQPWVMWIDSDDLFTGEFPDLSNYSETPNACVVCPYEYAYDDRGNCISHQYRERIVRKADGWEWRKRVHEGLFLKEGTPNRIEWNGAVWKHQRTDGVESNERNYRLLKLDYADNPNDARICHDYGVACLQHDNANEGLEALAKAYELSQWDEEKAACACRIVQYGMTVWSKPNKKRDPVWLREWASKAIEAAPHLASPYAYACELATYCANDSNAFYPEAIGDMIRFGEAALAQKDAKALFFSNPMQLAFNVPMALHMAALRCNDIEKAKLYIEQCLNVNPRDANVQSLKWALESLDPNFIPAKPTMEWDVVFACMSSPEAWGPDSIDEGGIGGSETAVIHMARELARLGLRVGVYAGIKEELIDEENAFGAVGYPVYRRIERIGEVKHTKLLVAWRHAAMLEVCPADERWLWVHDVMPIHMTPWRMHLADKILALSNWHKETLVQAGAPEEKVWVTRNGIDPKRFDRTDITRNPLKAVYTSSPDRGLEDLLDMWPEIAEGVRQQIGRVPELHVYYGDKWVQPELSKKIRSKMRQLGVINHGRLGQKDLAEELLSAVAWLYPTNFDETFCISALEAKCAGLEIVAYPRAALPETAGANCFYANSREQFVEYATYAFCFKTSSVFDAGAYYANEGSWQSVAKEWRDEFNAIEPKSKVEVISEPRPTLNMYLAENASGSIIFNPLDPDIVRVGGGCRDGFIGLAKAMGALGKYNVRAASTWSIDHKSAHGVDWIALQNMQQFGRPDIALAYYDTSTLAGMQGCLRIASHHTYKPFEHFAWADVNVAPSAHSVERLKAKYAPQSPWYVLPNGVRDEGIEWKPVPGRVIYHTSPDRGLHLLLRIWPYIRASVPHASLHVVGNVDGMLNAKRVDSSFCNEYARRCEEMRIGKAEAEAAGGVRFLGRVSREELRKVLSEASCFAFPASLLAPSETFSVSLMECCKIGIPVVTSDADSLREIYGEHAMVISEVEKNMVTFGQTVVALLRGHAFQQAMSAEGKRLAAKYTFENQAKILDDIIQRHLH